MTTAKRILGLLLALALLMSLPVAAFATESGGAVDPGGGITGDFDDEDDTGSGSGGDDGGNGGFSPYPIQVDTVTLTFDTNGGTEIRSLTVKKGTNIDLSKYIPEKGELYFDGWYLDEELTIGIDRLTISEDMTIYAGWRRYVSCSDCPRDVTCPMYPYEDLDTHEWYHDGVHFCIENGFMGSTSSTRLTFEPNTTTTRAMIVTLLWRLEGEPLVDYPISFEDVGSGIWYTEAIRWAQANKIVEGYSDAKFGPNDPITREQLAVIMWRYAKYKGYDVSVGENTNILSYGDAFDVAEWAVSAVQWACGVGLINGISGNIVPQGSATRAQAATILYRFCLTIVRE